MFCTYFIEKTSLKNKIIVRLKKKCYFCALYCMLPLEVFVATDEAKTIFH